MRVYLNGIAITSGRVSLTYEEIVALAGKHGHPSVTYTCPSSTGAAVRAGTMNHASKPLELVDGMAISVIHTDNA